MFRILKYLKPYKWSVFIVVILVVSRAILEIILPNYMTDLLNDSLYGNAANGDNSLIIKYTFLMVGIILIIITVTIISRYFESKVASGFAKEVREVVYKKIESFSLAEIDKFSIASLITRTSNDIQQLQSYVTSLLGWLILQPVMAVGAIIMALRINAPMTLVLAISLFSLLVVIATVYYIVVPKFSIMQKLVDKMNLVTRENLTGLRVVRAQNTQKFQEDKFEEINKSNMKLNMFIGRMNAILWPFMGLIMGLTSLAVVFFSKEMINFTAQTGYSPTDMMLIQQYSMRALMSIMFISVIFIMLPRARVSADRIFEVLDTDVSILTPDHPIFIDKDESRGKIEFKDVMFKYGETEVPILSNISFVAEPNKTTAIIGSTGSGKSSLINLIPRLYDVNDGEILIDDIPIKDIDLKTLYSLIGYVPQKGTLFSGTISSNIAFGEGSSLDTIEESSKIAQAYNFINEFKDDFASPITQGGTNVSGGQRQRLSIARAINKQPRILIFDDSFSALDYQTDKLLRKELEKVNATKIIVAQRINTIINADQIIVLNNGVIESIGTHKELLKNSKVYQEIAYSQLSKEELEDE